MFRVILLFLGVSCLCPGVLGQKSPVKASSGGRAAAVGRYEYIDNEIRIRPAEGDKLEINFEGFWPNSRRRVPGVSPNSGSFSETVPFRNNTAIVKLAFSGGECTIRIRFSGDRLIVHQDGEANACGFGFNVSAAGVYKRVRERK